MSDEKSRAIGRLSTFFRLFKGECDKIKRFIAKSFAGLRLNFDD